MGNSSVAAMRGSMRVGLANTPAHTPKACPKAPSSSSSEPRETPYRRSQARAYLHRGLGVSEAQMIVVEGVELFEINEEVWSDS